MTNVTLRSVSKTFAGIAAVRDLSFEVERGEFVVLLGPSGCGKTTTLRMIAGFDRPSAGHIYFAGQDVTAVPPRLRNIGMVFQSYALFPNMTVAQNIGFGLRQRRLARKTIDARVAELLELILLTNRANDYCAELSGGQQQRVALARALSFSPQVLLMDEPLGALDLKLRETMQVELRRIQRDLKITTILVTHDQQEAMTLADRIAIMSDGCMQQIGSPDELYNRPANIFVANFIGKNNVLDGEIIALKEDGYRVRLARDLFVEVTSPTPRAIGARLEIALRPEKLLVTPMAFRPDANMLTGIVDQRQFLGNLVNYFVRLPSGQTLLTQHAAGTTPVGIGERVHVSWRSADMALFDAPAGGI